MRMPATSNTFWYIWDIEKKKRISNNCKRQILLPTYNLLCERDGKDRYMLREVKGEIK